MVESVFNDIKSWVHNVGLSVNNKHQLTSDYISSLMCEDFNKLDMEDFEELMLKISSYNIYLKSVKGSLEAQIQIISDQLKRKLWLAANNLGVDYKFKSTDEKRAVVLASNKEISNLQYNLSTVKAKFLKIKDIPFAIDKKLVVIKLKYHRRLNASKEY